MIETKFRYFVSRMENQELINPFFQDSFYDLNLYSHERREFEHYKALGYVTGEPYDPNEAYRLWNNTHTATLEEFGITDEKY